MFCFGFCDSCVYIDYVCIGIYSIVFIFYRSYGGCYDGDCDSSMRDIYVIFKVLVDLECFR